MSTDVSEEHISSCHLLSRWFLARHFFQIWRWRQYVPPKLRLTFNGLHGVISQKIVLFITTAVRTSNPTDWRGSRLIHSLNFIIGHDLPNSYSLAIPDNPWAYVFIGGIGCALETTLNRSVNLAFCFPPAGAVANTVLNVAYRLYAMSDG
jgi:hypothetical protein